MVGIGPTGGGQPRIALWDTRGVTNHFMHVSDRRAIDAVDQTTLALPAAATPAEERAVILSTFLKGEIAAPSAELPAGGPRFADFNELLAMKPKDLRGGRRRRPCR